MQTFSISNGYNLLTGKMAQKGYLGVVDQAVVSGSNFLTGVILGRFVAPAEFGVFVLAWTTLMIALAVQNALVCTPMSVIGAQKPEDEISTYWGSLLIVQVLLGIGLCLIITAGCAFLRSGAGAHAASPASVPFISATILSCFFLLGQEFFRRLLIVRLDLKETLVNDIVTHAIRLGGMLILLYAGGLNATNSLLVIGASLAVGTAIGHFRLANAIRVSFGKVRHDFLESWRFGRWVLGEMLPYTMSVQGYIYLTAFLIGAQATAALGASQNILNASNVLLLSFTNILTPIAARRYSTGGDKALSALMAKSGLLLAFPILGFYLLAMIFAEEILTVVYRMNYAGYGPLLVVCSIYFIVSYFTRVLQVMLYAKSKPAIGFRAKMLSLAVMVIIAYPLIRFYGVYGAAAGTVISQLVVLFGFLFYLSGARQSEKPG